MLSYNESIAAFPMKKNDRPFKKGDRVVLMSPAGAFYKLCVVLTSSARGCKVGDENMHTEDQRTLFGQLSGTEIKDGRGPRNYIIHRPEPLNVEWLKSTLHKQHVEYLQNHVREMRKMLAFGQDDANGQRLQVSSKFIKDQIKQAEDELAGPIVVGEFWEKVRNHKFSWNKS